MLPPTDALMQIFKEDRWYDELELVTHFTLPFNSYQIQKVLSLLNNLVEKNWLVKVNQFVQLSHRKVHHFIIL